jgi:O-acetyl-ADP-ribose deacetylase (regulator of RNase III)
MMKKNFNRSILELCQGDITQQKVDVIVNAANARLSGGGGVDGAIHKAGGPTIMEECQRIGGCPTGNAVITAGGKLSANYVIHAVGPIYRGGGSGEAALLKSAYQASLNLTTGKGLVSIAFPSISTGAYGYPIEKASKIAFSAIIEHLKGNTCIKRVIFVLFSQKDFEIYRSSLEEIIENCEK